jgi:hypothetical protein
VMYRVNTNNLEVISNWLFYFYILINYNKRNIFLKE